MSVRDAVIAVLQEAGKPLHAKEITKRILSINIGRTSGKINAIVRGWIDCYGAFIILS